MPNETQAQATLVPTPARITPELLKLHSITADEYARIEQALGRTPSLTELGIYSVMWSEHCSYKSSRVHLKRLPTKSELVVQGPGENAGIIDVGDGWACAFKIESHNHPSYIEPYQGAATGVGGILRDIFTMGARPLAVMDSLRFGPLDDTALPKEITHKNHAVVEGVVHGIAGYGNCFGVPNLGGETRFEPCYSGNPLVNAFALGLVKRDEIFYAKATGIGNPVIYVGAKTGRDGIHGATMASEEFKEGSEQKRPNVQMGDPFMEKLLLEACLEVMQIPGAVAGIQDMGAAGLTCSTCEMGARGGVGLEVELDNVPQRETGMNSYEIMLSESQERMLLVANEGREQEVLDVFAKWGLDARIVGKVIAQNRMRIFHHGELVADLSNESLTDDAPLYHRPVGTWAAPVAKEAPAGVLDKAVDHTAALTKLLAASNICDKRWVFEQYDSMVQTNTVQGPGNEAGVMRIKGTSRALSMALAGNGRWCYLDPLTGAKHAVAEAARKVACTGAKPVAATNCLNFGNPEKPEIMAQLSAAIDGISESCTALGTPVTGGNVSLYNETRGVGIYPTPVLGIVGILDDVTKATPAHFSQAGDVIVLISPNTAKPSNWQAEFGSSEFAKTVLGQLWGVPPAIDLAKEAELHQMLQLLARRNFITSASDISDGGLAVALAKATFRLGLGAEVKIDTELGGLQTLFSEPASTVLVTCSHKSVEALVGTIEKDGTLMAQPIGTVTADGTLSVTVGSENVIRAAVGELKQVWSQALESRLATEVLA
ncbi:phosphoribosylformylglycinamidine synthase subunit PurL [Terriglobus sp. 2YAB30_2]|uniref:phosphoribosylformylglycinamidine synthase subunit PurL n=1 Tax=unclassified Terriglobus TaxID=2628988 RepID=UPI003F947111